MEENIELNNEETAGFQWHGSFLREAEPRNALFVNLNTCLERKVILERLTHAKLAAAAMDFR